MIKKSSKNYIHKKKIKIVFQMILDIFHYYIFHQKLISFDLYSFQNQQFLYKKKSIFCDNYQ